MIVLDASVLIAYLDRDDHNHLSAEALLANAVDEDLRINPLTLAEVLVGPARQGQLETVRTALRDLEIRELRFPPDAAVRLAQLRVDTGLKMPDCCVLLAAAHAAATVATFDDRLAIAAAARNVPVRTR